MKYYITVTVILNQIRYFSRQSEAEYGPFHYFRYSFEIISLSNSQYIFRARLLVMIKSYLKTL